MNRDFKNRIELLSYTERRVIIDIDRYARDLLRMGDIFPPDPYGVYDAVTGDCLVDFGKGGYWIDNSSGRDRRHEIFDFRSFEEAKGNVFNHQGIRTVSSMNIRRIQITDDRPMIFKARQAGASLYAQALMEMQDYAKISPNIQEVRETLYLEEIERSQRLSASLAGVTHSIESSIWDDFEYDKFKELIFSKKSGVYMVDVAADIRIRDYYLRRFEEEALQREQEEMSEEGYRSH